MTDDEYISSFQPLLLEEVRPARRSTSYACMMRDLLSVPVVQTKACITESAHGRESRDICTPASMECAAIYPCIHDKRLCEFTMHLTSHRGSYEVARPSLSAPSRCTLRQ